MRKCVYHADMRRPQDFSIDAASVRTLRRWLRSTTLPQGQITRAKIILGLHAGKTPSDIARKALCKVGVPSEMRLCHEAGPCGYGLARELQTLVVHA